MKKNIKYIGLIGIFVLAFTLCTGCGNKEKEEKQLSYRAEGIAYFEQEEYEKALECFENALADSTEINKVEMDICFYKAKALFKLGDTDGAMETYNAIIEYNESATAYFLRGNLYYSLGDEEKALADYEKAITCEGAVYDLYIGIYETLVANDKEAKGKEYLNKALELKANDTADKIKTGYIHFLLGENEKAIEILEEASKDDPESYYYLFLIYDDTEEEEKAYESLTAYMKNVADLDSYKLFEMGENLMKNERYSNAAECFSRALELEKVPNKQEIMKHLVIAYEKDLDFEAAKEVMKEYVEEYPEDEEAYREYTFLETR